MTLSAPSGRVGLGGGGSCWVELSGGRWLVVFRGVGGFGSFFACCPKEQAQGPVLRNPQSEQHRAETRRRLSYPRCCKDRRTRGRQENQELPPAGQAGCRTHPSRTEC